MALLTVDHDTTLLSRHPPVIPAERLPLPPGLVLAEHPLGHLDLQRPPRHARLPRLLRRQLRCLLRFSCLRIGLRFYELG